MLLLSVAGCKKSGSDSDTPHYDSVNIQGTIVDVNGQPLNNAYIYAYLDGEYSFAATTADGKFTISILREDTRKSDVLLSVQGPSYNYEINDAVVNVTKGNYDVGKISVGRFTGDRIDATYQIHQGFASFSWKPTYDFSIDSFTVKIEKGVTTISTCIDTSRVFPNVSFSFSDTTITGEYKTFTSFVIKDSKRNTVYSSGFYRDWFYRVDYILTQYSTKKYGIIEGTFNGSVLVNGSPYTPVSEGRFRLRLRKDAEIIK